MSSFKAPLESFKESKLSVALSLTIRHINIYASFIIYNKAMSKPIFTNYSSINDLKSKYPSPLN